MRNGEESRNKSKKPEGLKVGDEKARNREHCRVEKIMADFGLMPLSWERNQASKGSRPRLCKLAAKSGQYVITSGSLFTA